MRLYSVLKYLPLLLLLCSSTILYATHNRAGEITYRQIGDLSIEVTISTYTKASSIQADRDSLTVNWGDGTTSRVPRTNGGGDGITLANDLKHNIYKGIHVYPGRTTYTISFQDPNRIGGIRNVDFPNSISVPFYVETTFTFLNPQFQGYNNSVILDNPPIDEACIGRKFEHNPGAHDSDGDSLAYELATPMQAVGEVVPKYEFPNEISPGPLNNLTFNQRTGELVWQSPQLIGEYNVAIKIKEYRNGVLINTVIRDMQINVRQCEGVPPVVTTTTKVCKVAGEHIQVDVLVDDQDFGDQVKISASGGPFLTKYDPAVLIGPDTFVNPTLQALFSWETKCAHISNSAYVTIFKGEDNEFGEGNSASGLVDLQYMETWITGPAPQNLFTMRVANSIQLEWDYRYRCDTARDDYFKGFTIWRKIGSTQVDIDTCGTDLSNYGYSEIDYVQNDTLNDQYFYVDKSVEKGLTYCYRVTAEFSLTSPGGFPYNRVQSLPSDEHCSQLARDIPLINHASVIETDLTSGKIMVAWLPPLASDLDTITNRPPYHIDILQGLGLNGGMKNFVARKTYQSFAELNRSDTVFIDGLNTSEHPYHFQLSFYTDDTNLYGTTQEASSTFLNRNPSNKTINLSWDFDVPWTNLSYTIFQIDVNSGTRDLIGSTTRQTFSHGNLINGNEYCYVIEAVGSYTIASIPDSMKNLSQSTCAIPLDTIPPCRADLALHTSCDDETFNLGDPFIANISWSYPMCEDSSDIERIFVYFTPFGSQDSLLIFESTDLDVMNFIYEIDQPTGGCFYIITQDFVGNISVSGKQTCIETCPIYELPNVFTPNNDGANEIFGPYPYRFVSEVDFKVFTRWGNLVFETKNPDIQWDGRDLNGNELNEDTYFYTCEVFSIDQNRLIPTLELNGNITIIKD